MAIPAPEDYGSSYKKLMGMMMPVQDFFKPREGNNQGLNIDEGQSMYKPLFNDRQGNNQGLNVEEGAVINPVTAQPPQQKVQPTPQEITSQIFADPPAPKYDKARQDRIKQIGKVVALGEGLKALGDVFALNRGALVPLRQQNQDPRNLYMAWQGYEDQYNNRMDEYNRQLFNTKLQALYRKEDRDWREKTYKEGVQRDNDRFNWQKDIQNRQFESIDEDRKQRRLDREEDNALALKRFEEQLKLQKQAQSLNWAEFNQRQKEYNDKKKMLEGAGLTEDKDNIILSGDRYGEDVRIDKRYLDKVLALIVNDNLLSTDDMDLLKPQLGESVTAEQKKYIIAKYWQRSPAVSQWLIGPQTNTDYTMQDLERAKADIYGQSGRNMTGRLNTPSATTTTTQSKNPFDF